MIQAGEIAPRMGLDGKLVPLSRIEILNQWSLWWCIVMMVVASIISVFAKPEIFRRLFTLFSKQPDNKEAKSNDVLREIEVPLWISYIGVPIFSLAGVWMHITSSVFRSCWRFSLGLVYLLTMICINSIALTSWVPTSGLAKITQFAIGGLDRSNPASNLIPAGMSAEVASSAAVLLSDIKPGYMLGASAAPSGDRTHDRYIRRHTCVRTGVLFTVLTSRCRWRTSYQSKIVSDQFAFPPPCNGKVLPS